MVRAEAAQLGYVVIQQQRRMLGMHLHHGGDGTTAAACAVSPGIVVPSVGDGCDCCVLGAHGCLF